ncbi:GTPase HflX [Candidatus Cryosericum septentrionale]|jgi:GTP-binding protein HflX|uniref:GTPase HflX n=1 Tax=Candidatus Cryosericum septentrionale TaxID=2290913 RepID=A0A398DQE9_9BACT|nr:GTPase HflX [Candidatus Cryosericum septentrionale]RIE17150.1 GTPase HflX [Candidatus Cryosericum septentrionale]
MSGEGIARTAVIVSVRRIGEIVDPDRPEETRQLAEGLGVEVLESKTYVQRIPQRFLLGKGQVEELHELLQALRADLVIFDSELTPLQYRHMIDHLESSVMDRARLILETFASQAHTAEARKRVQIAERLFELTQLRAMNAGYDQQAGYIGMRGPGETLFQKRRRAKRSEIHDLREEVKEVDTRYAIKTHTRQESAIAKIAVVGYTNAGKSTMINLLAGSELLVEDRLFATLDTAARPAHFGRQSTILIDTVGFIRDLPESLMDSFRSTLEEARDADLLLHVVDAGVRDLHERVHVVNTVLARIGCADIPRVLIFNKIDTVDQARRESVLLIGTGFLVSAATLEGIDRLKDHIAEVLLRRVVHGRYAIPFTEPGARAEVYAGAVVLNERLTARSWIIEAAGAAPGARLPQRFLRKD